MIPIIEQTTSIGLDSILYLLPIILCCALMPLLQRGGKGPAAGEAHESDAWFLSTGIAETYETLKKEVEGWRGEAEQQPASSGFGLFSFGKKKEPEVRFGIADSKAPRLLRLMDKSEGEIIFELTEVEGGGTSVRVSFGIRARNRIRMLRAQTPIKIPAGLGKQCPSCGKLILSDLKTCPYCGKLIE